MLLFNIVWFGDFLSIPEHEIKLRIKEKIRDFYIFQQEKTNLGINLRQWHPIYYWSGSKNLLSEVSILLFLLQGRKN
jgi:hypothetical protein